MLFVSPLALNIRRAVQFLTGKLLLVIYLVNDLNKLTFNSLSLRAIAKQSHGIAEPVPRLFEEIASSPKLLAMTGL